MSAHRLLFMGEQPETFDRERLYDGTEPPFFCLCGHESRHHHEGDGCLFCDCPTPHREPLVSAKEEAP